MAKAYFVKKPRSGLWQRNVLGLCYNIFDRNIPFDSNMFRFEKEFRDNPGYTGESWAIKFLEFGEVVQGLFVKRFFGRVVRRTQVLVKVSRLQVLDKMSELVSQS